MVGVIIAFKPHKSSYGKNAKNAKNEKLGKIMGGGDLYRLQ